MAQNWQPVIRHTTSGISGSFKFYEMGLVERRTAPVIGVTHVILYWRMNRSRTIDAGDVLKKYGRKTWRNGSSR